MKIRFPISFCALVTLSLTVASSSTWAQTTVPRDRIPADIPAEVKTEVESLYLPGTVDRCNAAMRLSMMRDRAAPAVPFLIGLLHDRRDEVVINNVSGVTTVVIQAQVASDVLAAIGKPAIRPLGEALHGTDSTVAKFAGRALAVMHDPEAVRVLMTALKSTDGDRRSMVADHLKESSDFRVVEPLLASLAVKDPQVRRDAVATLEAISGEKYGADSQKWLEWWQREYGKVLDRVERLIPLFQSDDSRVPGVIAATLEEITGERFGQGAAQWRQWLENQRSKQAKLRAVPSGPPAPATIAP